MVKGPVLLHQDDDVLGIKEVVPGSGSIAIARELTREQPVAPIPDNIAACRMKSRREVDMVTILCGTKREANKEIRKDRQRAGWIRCLEREDCVKWTN